MNLVREAFSLPGYVYNYVAGSWREPSSEPLLEQARVPLNAAEPEFHCCTHSQHCGELLYIQKHQTVRDSLIRFLLLV